MGVVVTRNKGMRGGSHGALFYPSFICKSVMLKATLIFDCVGVTMFINLY